jgi:hypothetical protein
MDSNIQQWCLSVAWITSAIKPEFFNWQLFVTWVIRQIVTTHSIQAQDTLPFSIFSSGLGADQLHFVYDNLWKILALALRLYTRIVRNNETRRIYAVKSIQEIRSSVLP